MRAGEIIKIRKGRAPSSMKEGNEIIYLTPEYLRGNTPATHVFDSGNLVEVSENDVLLLWDGSNAGEIFKGKKGALSSTMVVLLFDNNRYHKDYIFYQFKQNEAFLRAQTNGSGIPHVDKEILHSIEITPFLYDTQKEICKVLSLLDRCILQSRKIVEKHEMVMRGLMQDLLTKGIDGRGNIRSEKTDNFIVRKGLKVPEDWNVITLKECVRPNTVITYGIVQTGPDLPEGIKVLRTLDLKADGINTKNLLKTTPEISSTYSRTILEEGDIVCNVRASVGDFNIVPEELAGINISRGVARISPRKGIDNIFLLWFLKSEANKKQMELLIKGTTFIDINIKDLREIAVPIPKSTNEQLLIGSILEENLKALKDEQSNLAKLQSLKTGLMQDLLTGKVKVPESILNPVN